MVALAPLPPLRAGAFGVHRPIEPRRHRLLTYSYLPAL